MKYLLVISLCIVIVSCIYPSVKAQDQYEEIKDYFDSHTSILLPINAPGTYGLIQITEQKALGNTSKWVLTIGSVFKEIFTSKEVTIVQGSKITTPEFFYGEVNHNVNVCVVHNMKTGSIYGIWKIIVYDIKHDYTHSISFNGTIISGIVPYKNGFILRQENEFYHNSTFIEIYSYLSLVDEKLNIQTYGKRINL